MSQVDEDCTLYGDGLGNDWSAPIFARLAPAYPITADIASIILYIRNRDPSLLELILTVSSIGNHKRVDRAAQIQVMMLRPAGLYR